jgi:hypothetical protein
MGSRTRHLVRFERKVPGSRVADPCRPQRWRQRRGGAHWRLFRVTRVSWGTRRHLNGDGASGLHVLAAGSFASIPATRYSPTATVSCSRSATPRCFSMHSRSWPGGTRGSRGRCAGSPRAYACRVAAGCGDPGGFGQHGMLWVVTVTGFSRPDRRVDGTVPESRRAHRVPTGPAVACRPHCLAPGAPRPRARHGSSVALTPQTFETHLPQLRLVLLPQPRHHIEVIFGRPTALRVPPPATRHLQLIHHLPSCVTLCVVPGLSPILGAEASPPARGLNANQGPATPHDASMSDCPEHRRGAQGRAAPIASTTPSGTGPASAAAAIAIGSLAIETHESFLSVALIRTTPSDGGEIDPDVLSIHRGLLLFLQRVGVRNPGLDRLGSSRGAEAPLLHRISLGATRRLPPALGKTAGLGRFIDIAGIQPDGWLHRV